MDHLVRTGMFIWFVQFGAPEYIFPNIIMIFWQESNSKFSRKGKIFVKCAEKLEQHLFVIQRSNARILVIMNVESKTDVISIGNNTNFYAKNAS